MKASRSKTGFRLAVMFFFNIALLYFTNKYLSTWRSENRKIRLHEIAAMMSVVPLILAVATLFGGTIWQRLVTVVFCVLPAAILLAAVQVLLKSIL